MGRIQDSLIFSKPSLNGVRTSARMTVGQQMTTMAGSSVHQGGGSMIAESLVTKLNSARPMQIQSARTSYGGAINDSQRFTARNIHSAKNLTQRAITTKKPSSGAVSLRKKIVNYKSISSKVDWSHYKTTSPVESGDRNNSRKNR